MQRLNCERFPCHRPQQDCSLCFCPFYPCRDERTGGREVDGSWCCENCHIVHQKEVAEMVLDGLLQGQSIAQVWKRLEALL
ncbi:cysteine-rich small domain-containing protein [Methanothrix sp.]|jgi:threonine-phosphate decarboxylase|uniref:cysteine-rich small domain-containing protein n=1 Tax=Methanothrix sp. TaxID=90426 RepID=UPI001BD3A032